MDRKKSSFFFFFLLAAVRTMEYFPPLAYCTHTQISFATPAAYSPGRARHYNESLIGLRNDRQKRGRRFLLPSLLLLCMHFPSPKKEEEEDGPSMLTSFTQFLRLLLYGNITSCSALRAEGLFLLLLLLRRRRKSGAWHQVCWQQGGHLRLSWYLLRALRGERSWRFSCEAYFGERRGRGQLEVTHFILRPKWMGASDV